MQQTADVDAETKEQTTVDADSDLATILVSGLSYFFYAVAVTAVVMASAV